MSLHQLELNSPNKTCLCLQVYPPDNGNIKASLVCILEMLAEWTDCVVTQDYRVETMQESEVRKLAEKDGGGVRFKGSVQRNPTVTVRRRMPRSVPGSLSGGKFPHRKSVQGYPCASG